MTKAKRIGRPIKPVDTAVPRRVPLGLRVTPTVKAALEKEALATGRSQSQVAELLIETFFREDRLVAKLDQILARLSPE